MYGQSFQFLQRQREFSDDKSIHVSELRNVVRGVRAQHLEAQMRGQHRLSREPTLIQAINVPDAYQQNLMEDPDMSGGKHITSFQTPNQLGILFL